MILVMPFLSDTVGNVANLFDTIGSTDDVLHFLNWIFLVAALTVILAPIKLPRWNRIFLGAGSGALAIVIGEIVEYLIVESGTRDPHLTYGNTIGDLALSTIGAAVGAIAVVFLRIGESCSNIHQESEYTACSSLAPNWRDDVRWGRARGRGGVPFIDALTLTPTLCSDSIIA
jgi:hypothetical protein